MTLKGCLRSKRSAVRIGPGVPQTPSDSVTPSAAVEERPIAQAPFSNDSDTQLTSPRPASQAVSFESRFFGAINPKRTSVKKIRKGVRRGRILDSAFMQFARDMGCVLRGRHVCSGVITFHHVRFCGSPKDDTHGFGLCEAGHLHGAGKYSIERLGKRKWQALFHIDIEQEIARLRTRFAAATGEAA